MTHASNATQCWLQMGLKTFQIFRKFFGEIRTKSKGLIPLVLWYWPIYFFLSFRVRFSRVWIPPKVDNMVENAIAINLPPLIKIHFFVQYCKTKISLTKNCKTKYPSNLTAAQAVWVPTWQIHANKFSINEEIKHYL